MIEVSTYLSVVQRERLLELAAGQGLSLSAYLRRLIVLDFKRAAA